jgi:hypothetical protein
MFTCARRGVRAIAILTVVITGPAWAQEASSPKVSDYSSFDAGAVVSEAARLRADSPADKTAQRALAGRAAALVLEAEAPQGRPTELWNQLATLAAPALSDLPPEQREPLRLKLLGGASAGAPAEWADLQARVLLVSAVDNSGRAATALIEGWLQSHELDSLSISELQFCIKHSLPNNVDRKAFTVTWTGMLTASRTGAYKFSTTPINVNKQFGVDRVRHTLVAAVGDATVLNAVPPTPEELRARMASRINEAGTNETPSPEIVEWPFEGDPVQLQAGQAVPIRVDMTYECTQPSPADMPTAILCWEGPGMSRQPVFKEALSSGDGAAPGLRAEYRWQEHGEPRTAVAESSVVDFAWASPASVAPSNPELLARLTERYWGLATDPAYIDKCASGEVHAFVQDDESTACLSAAQRQAFLELATNNAALLDRLTDGQLLLTYRKLRFGAEEQALDFVGRWMQQHANVAPAITSAFYEQNREVYRQLADHLARQQYGQHAALRDEYLELDGGECALPVAYTTTYALQIVDRLAALALPGPEADARKSASSEWIEQIDETLANTALPSNQRINWLIARAQAAEAMTSASPSVAIAPRENYLAGLKWILESRMHVKDITNYQRSLLEEVARLAAMNRQAQLDTAIDAAEGVDPVVLASWKAEVGALRQLRRDQIARDRESSRSAHRRILEERREQAVQRDDRDEIARYDALLSRGR